jgi:hypothetical protein
MEQQKGSFFRAWYDLYQIDPIKASVVETKCPDPATVSRHELRVCNPEAGIRMVETLC